MGKKLEAWKVTQDSYTVFIQGIISSSLAYFKFSFNQNFTWFSLCFFSDNQLVSASEDGTVRIWDMRQSSATNIITPHENDKLVRPELGAWMGAAAISDDWLVSFS